MNDTTTAISFKKMFKGVTLEVDDLYLLESFQISYLPGWVAERDFAALLWDYPSIQTYMEKRHPPIAQFIRRIKDQYGPEFDQEELGNCVENLLWTIADLIVYNKFPEVYDSLDFHNWDLDEVTSITPLDGMVVVDGGAGTGRVAIEASSMARNVYALEPVSRLRQFIKDKVAKAGLKNVYVIDGFLDSIPLPNHFADVLITSHALGWNLEEELREFERVVCQGGFIIHCPGTSAHEEEKHLRLVSTDWQYEYLWYEAPDGRKRKYWKQN
jgi:hypothetical protein